MFSYGEDNLMEIIMDLAFLSEADFNVCTMSSAICKRTLDFKEVSIISQFNLTFITPKCNCNCV